MNAPLVLDAIAFPPVLVPEGPELEAGVASVGTAATGAWELDGTAVETVLFEPVPPGRYDGGGTALEASTRAPLPQGIPWPSGWVSCGAAMVVPFGNAIAKRPVQRRSEALAAWENW